tara:strand:+ start:868 stop:1083 length:216 start_codon:yes stop_codon:yes gene_type:complete
MARLMTEDELISYYEDNVMEAFLCQEQNDNEQAEDIKRINNWVAHDLRRFAIEIVTIDTLDSKGVKITDLQ